MKTTRLGLGLAAGLWAAAALAESAPAPLILRVFDDLYTATELRLAPGATECRDLEPLVKGVIGPLLAAYVQQAGIAVSEDELKEYCRRQLSDEVLFSETWAEWAPNGNLRQARQQAQAQLTVWKVQQSLFGKYGGRVSRSDGAPPQAFDALLAFVAEREQAGDFTIHDERLKLRFWECLRTPPDSLVSEAEGRVTMEEHPADRQKRHRLPTP